MCAPLPPPPTQPHDVIILRHAPQHTVIGPGEKHIWGHGNPKRTLLSKQNRKGWVSIHDWFPNKKLLRWCPVVMHVENCCMSYSNFFNFWVIVYIYINAGAWKGVRKRNRKWSYMLDLTRVTFPVLNRHTSVDYIFNTKREQRIVLWRYLMYINVKRN